MRKLSNVHPLPCYGFSIKILSCMHILPMPQMQEKITDDVTKLVIHRVFIFTTNL